MRITRDNLWIHPREQRFFGEAPIHRARIVGALPATPVANTPYPRRPDCDIMRRPMCVAPPRRRRSPASDPLACPFCAPCAILNVAASRSHPVSLDPRFAWNEFCNGCYETFINQCWTIRRRCLALGETKLRNVRPSFFVFPERESSRVISGRSMATSYALKWLKRSLRSQARGSGGY